jgi:nicotinate dehydrogenase subunit B
VNGPNIHSIYGAQLSRRSFLAAGGALIVTAVMSRNSPTTEGTGNTLDATAPASWIEIHADNTVLIRTGKCDFGQSSIYTAYRQIVAEELCVPLEAMTAVVSGDTDRTPDGGGTFGLLRTNVLNLRKVAAYTREAALTLAAQRFGVPRADVSVRDGIISSGNRSVTYGELVAGQSLDLLIPTSGEVTDFRGLTVTGSPPLKPTSEYTIVGRSFKNPSIPPKISGEAPWVGDIKLPGMLHARPIHPATLGSKLVSAGKPDTVRFPGAKVVVIGNFLAVVSPDEWEAVQAAQQVAASTQWSDWQGLPGHEDLFKHLQDKVDWTEIPVRNGRNNQGDAAGVLTKAPRVLKATYHVPYLKHAPIGPTVSLADVKADGSVTVHTHSQNPQYLRFLLAKMLGTPAAQVVVRTYPGPGHFGRSNGGNAGSEDEAVLLSRELRAPVRVQWMRQDDMQWSTQSSALISEIAIALDENGRIAAYQAAHKGPPMQDDRPIGAILAGLPTIDAPRPGHPNPIHSAEMNVADIWVYGGVPHVNEQGFGTIQIGQRESPIDVGLRDHSMRTPIQFQQNFPREVAISEAAALAGADPIQFRLDHVDNQRFSAILNRLRVEAGWESRPSPSPKHGATGSRPVRGQGVSIMLRDNGYWACACHVTVTPDTGKVKVDRLTIVADTGIAVNPLQLKRQVQAGCIMGLSEALHEEVSFDKGAITSVDWLSYPILTMAELPEIKVVIAPRPEFGVYGQGSESANALAAPAIAAAFFDATGKPARRFPLRPEYVKAMLESR